MCVVHQVQGGGGLLHVLHTTANKHSDDYFEQTTNMSLTSKLIEMNIAVKSFLQREGHSAACVFIKFIGQFSTKDYSAFTDVIQ